MRPLKSQDLIVMEHKEKGNIFFRKGDFAQAKACYEKAIHEDPKNIVFYSNLAAVYFEEHLYQECVDTCIKAILIGEKNNANASQIVKVLKRKGKALIKVQKFSEAVETFQTLNKVESNKEHMNLLKDAENFLKLEKDPAVNVRKSQIHGNGVFAVRDIEKDELVCLYDGEMMGQSHLLKLLRMGIDVDKEYWMSHPHNPRLILCGFKEPKTVLGIGQLINDFKKPEIVELDFKHGIRACEEYVTASREHQNVSFRAEGKMFWLYAAKDIKKDEELFLHYGYKIWLETLKEKLGSSLTFVADDSQPSKEGQSPSRKQSNNEKEIKPSCLWRLLYWALDGEVHGLAADGRPKVFKIEDAYDFEEVEYKKILEDLLRVPSEALENTKRKIKSFSHKDMFSSMLDMIEVDRVDSLILD